eukprot:scaffold3499_cov117-Isochrysis_galbana.AAC.12
MAGRHRRRRRAAVPPAVGRQLRTSAGTLLSPRHPSSSLGRLLRRLLLVIKYIGTSLCVSVTGHQRGGGLFLTPDPPLKTSRNTTPHTNSQRSIWVPQPGPKYQVMPGGEKGEVTMEGEMRSRYGGATLQKRAESYV